MKATPEQEAWTNGYDAAQRRLSGKLIDALDKNNLDYRTGQITRNQWVIVNRALNALAEKHGLNMTLPPFALGE